MKENEIMFQQKRKEVSVKNELFQSVSYNGTEAYIMNTNKAKELSFIFSNIEDWMYD